MPSQITLPFGRWPSPITPKNTSLLLDISEPGWDGSGSLLWRERDSSQAAIMIQDRGKQSVRSLTSGFNPGGHLLYGGGAYAAGHGKLIYADRGTGQLILAGIGPGESVPITSDLVLPASPCLSPDGQTVLFAHSNGEQDALYLVGLEGDSPPRKLVGGDDFYNYPRWNPAGNRLAWMSWNHPCMPWESSSIWLGELERGSDGIARLASRERIAGGENISALQPEFSPDGRWLAYLSDASGWWQIYLFDLASGTHRQLTSAAAEHALPPWLQNRGAYGFSPDSQRIYFLRNQSGVRSLWTVDLQAGGETRIPLDQGYTWMDWLAVSPVQDRIALVASAWNIPPRLISVEPDGKTALIRQAGKESLPEAVYARPQPLTWTRGDRQKIHGLFYPPHNPAYRGNGKPPLLLIIHSGPTRQKFAEFQPRTQYFTSRGFGVLEVNYRGSSGYGRAYRQSLAGGWGVIDVEDCLSGALHLVDLDQVDRNSLFLMGSSSGGLTVFQILVQHPGVFQAGISLYGVVNHLTLLQNPPKFERHYSDWLIGPYPEQLDRYRERSPVFFASRIQDPVAIFQGGRDPIVPQEQAEQIVQALKENGLPCQYTLYPEEGHGFKQAANIEDFYQQTEQFLHQFLPQE